MSPAEFHQRVQQMGEHGSITMKRAELEEVSALAAHAETCLFLARMCAAAALVWGVCFLAAVFA